MTERARWMQAQKSRSEAAQHAYEDEARISEFRTLVHRVRTELGLTQSQPAPRIIREGHAVVR